jgi:hypothetical protein
MQVDAPLSVSCAGGRYASQGIYETPDTLEAVYEYPPCPLNSAGFLARFCYHLGRGPDEHSYGTQFYGTDGTLFINREGYTIWPPALSFDKWETFGPTGIEKGDGTAQHQPHVVNFLDCVRSRKKPNADIETTHRTLASLPISRCGLAGNCGGIARRNSLSVMPTPIRC